MSFSGKWMELEIMLIEISEIEKDKYHTSLSCVESRPKKMSRNKWEGEG
jgi:hypothetical protein